MHPVSTVPIELCRNTALDLFGAEEINGCHGNVASASVVGSHRGAGFDAYVSGSVGSAASSLGLSRSASEASFDEPPGTDEPSPSDEPRQPDELPQPDEPSQPDESSPLIEPPQPEQPPQPADGQGPAGQPAAQGPAAQPAAQGPAAQPAAQGPAAQPAAQGPAAQPEAQPAAPAQQEQNQHNLHGVPNGSVRFVDRRTYFR